MMARIRAIRNPVVTGKCYARSSAAGAFLPDDPPTRGVFAILLLVTVIGTAIRWASGASTRLSSSGRSMHDGIPDYRSSDGAPHGH